MLRSIWRSREGGGPGGGAQEPRAPPPDLNLSVHPSCTHPLVSFITSFIRNKEMSAGYFPECCELSYQTTEPRKGCMGPDLQLSWIGDRQGEDPLLVAGICTGDSLVGLNVSPVGSV